MFSKIFLLITLILNLSLLCAESGAEQQETVNAEKTKPEQPVTSKIPTRYYQNLQLPPLNKPWTPHDYLQAVTILTPIGQQNPEFLPHYRDKVAEPYMQHLVNAQNIYQILQFATDQQLRIDLIIAYLDVIQRLLALYQQALHNKATPYYAEWVDIIGLCSYLAAVSAPELQAVLMTLNPNNAPKKEAITLLQAAMVNPVITGLQAIPRLSPLIAWRLIEQLNYTMPSYAQTLPMNSQQQIYHALLLAMQQAPNQQLREGEQKLTTLFVSAPNRFTP